MSDIKVYDCFDVHNYGLLTAEASEMQISPGEAMPQMIRIGEQSGSLDAMMLKTAVYYENELDREIKGITTTIEPILMVFLAFVAAAMVGAILLPVYGLVGESLSL